jgi:hypothetical protein
MKKFLIFALAVFVVSNAFGQSELPERQTKDPQVVTPAVQEDDTKIEAINSWNVTDTRGVTDPEARMSIASALPSSQAPPSSGQNPPAQKSHLLRNFIIIFALGAVLLVVLATQAKKS